MAAHAPMARVPFAPLDNPRLQHLASAKNRQNGLTAQKSPVSGKSSISASTTKRPFEPAIFEVFDSENVDPAVSNSPSKKSKSGLLDKSFTFSLAPTKSMPPPSTIPSRLSTPTRANMSSPRAPLTVPAGRSPKRKTLGADKSRRICAPFSRIDPPTSSSNLSALPFSLDAALSGTFSTPAPKSAGATIQESMPKNWFFDIYEDTPDEAAATLMEHSTLTLDLSSDDEGNKRERDDRGKENTPPEDYDAPSASRAAAEPTAARPRHVKKADIIRKKVITNEMDDGERSPLSDLETDSFFPEGLNKDSHVVVDPTPERSAAPTKLDINSLFAAPVSFTAGSTSKQSQTHTPSKHLVDMPIVTVDGDIKGDIIIWEDSPVSARLSSPTPDSRLDADASKGVIIADENTVPQLDDVV